MMRVLDIHDTRRDYTPPSQNLEGWLTCRAARDMILCKSQLTRISPKHVNRLQRFGQHLEERCVYVVVWAGLQAPIELFDLRFIRLTESEEFAAEPLDHLRPERGLFRSPEEAL